MANFEPCASGTLLRTQVIFSVGSFVGCTTASKRLGSPSLHSMSLICV